MMAFHDLPPVDEPKLMYGIWAAAWKGDTAAVSWLIRQGNNVDAVDDVSACGQTAAMRLSTHKRNPPSRSQDGFTPIMIAAACGHKGTVDHLISKGADMNLQCKHEQLGVTALHCSAITEQPDCVESLIKAGADTHLRDCCGDTPLDWAR